MPPNWRETESTSDAVRRLTAIIDERNAKKRNPLAGGGLEPAQIHDQPAVSPAEAEKAGSQSAHGVRSLNGCRRLTATDAWEVDSGSEYGGHATTEASEPHRYEVIGGRACPNPDSTADVDRAKDTLRGFE